MTQSVLPSEMRGVMTVTGPRGVGKSFLCAQADNPALMAFFDFEAKGEGIHNQLNFGTYRALTQEAKVGDPVDLYNITMDAFNTLPKDKYTVVVLDNISPLELAMNAEATRDAPRYAREFGLNLRNIVAARFGGSRAIVNFMISTRISNVLHAKGVRLVIATSHVGSMWGLAGPVPNKFRTKGADRWQELSILSLILVKGDRPPIPAALVQKEQLGTIRWDETLGEHIVSRRLPLRIPKCTFAEIRRYLAEPADLDNPAPGEVPTAEESDPFSETLSREQIAMQRMALESQQREEKGEDETMNVLQHPPEIELPEVDEELVERIKSMHNGSASWADIAQELGLSIPQVMKLAKS